MGVRADHAFIYLKNAVYDIRTKLESRPSILPKIALPEDLEPSDNRLRSLDECYYCEDIIDKFAEIEEREKNEKEGTVEKFLICKICVHSNSTLTLKKEDGRFKQIELSLDMEGRMTREVNK